MKWHTVREAAPLIGLSEEMVYRLCQSRRLHHRRIGTNPGRGRIEISDAGIAEYLKACEMPVVEPAPQVPAGEAAKKKKPRSTSGRPDGKPIRDYWLN